MATSRSINLSIPLIGNIALLLMTGTSGMGILPAIALAVALLLSATAISQ